MQKNKSDEESRCPSCRITAIPKNAAFCPSCGTRLNVSNQEAESTFRGKDADLYRTTESIFKALRAWWISNPVLAWAGAAGFTLLIYFLTSAFTVTLLWSFIVGAWMVSKYFPRQTHAGAKAQGSTEQFQTANEKIKTFLSVRKNQIIVGAGITFLIIFFIKAIGSGEVETCNDSSVLNVLAQNSIERSRERLITFIGQQGKGDPKMLNQARAISVKVSTINQISYDPQNKVRLCEGRVNYTNLPDAYTIMAMQLFGLQLCKDTIQYQITHPLDSRRFSVTWQCR